jgi:acetolactate synthase I/II/III large subunit
MSSTGDRLIELIQQGGATAIFGVPGGQTLPLYEAARLRGMTHIVMRDERSAACAADAAARISGSIGVCDATVGPGVTNLVSGLAEALQSGVPVIAIVADLPRGWDFLRERGVASQAVAQRALLESVTKATVRIDAPEYVDAGIRHAINVATSGRRGPVAIEVPDDVFAMRELPPQRMTRNESPNNEYVRTSLPSVDPSALRTLMSELREARRPVLYAGGGVLTANAAVEMSELAQIWQIPVVTSINGKGSIAETDAASAGVVGAFGSPRANAVLSAADLVVVIGSKFGQLGTFGWTLPDSIRQAIIHVDIDAAEIGRTGPCTLGIVSDARQFLRTLITHHSGDVQAGWWHQLMKIEEPVGVAEDQSIHPVSVMEQLNRHLRPTDVVVSDASLSSGWCAAQLVGQTAGRWFIAPRGLAGIGWAGGAAIGAAAAAPDQRVIAVAGDGAWGYTVGEIETAVRCDLDITFVVMNNSGLGWINHIEQRRQISPRSLFGPADFAAAARAFGARGIRVEHLAELAPSMASALGQRGPTLIEIVTALDVSPIVARPRPTDMNEQKRSVPSESANAYLDTAKASVAS